MQVHEAPCKYRKIILEKFDGTILTFETENPESEPVFLFRGQDALAPQPIEVYATLLDSRGLHDQADHARKHADAMRRWDYHKLPD